MMDCWEQLGIMTNLSSWPLLGNAQVGRLCSAGSLHRPLHAACLDRLFSAHKILDEDNDERIYH